MNVNTIDQLLSVTSRLFANDQPIDLFLELALGSVCNEQKGRFVHPAASTT